MASAAFRGDPSFPVSVLDTPQLLAIGRSARWTWKKFCRRAASRH